MLLVMMYMVLICWLYILVNDLDSGWMEGNCHMVYVASCTVSSMIYTAQLKPKDIVIKFEWEGVKKESKYVRTCESMYESMFDFCCSHMMIKTTCIETCLVKSC